MQGFRDQFGLMGQNEMGGKKIPIMTVLKCISRGLIRSIRDNY